MTPFVDDPDFQLHVGDALEVLRQMPAESVHCCVTSPPYWGLRDYGTGTWAGGDAECDHAGAKRKTRYDYSLESSPIQDGSRTGTDAKGSSFDAFCPDCGATRVDQQLGLEPTPDEYVTNMVAVFREVRRVLRADGTLWLNIGDSYNSSSQNNHGKGGPIEHAHLAPEDGWAGHRPFVPGLKPKDLVGIPWRLAFALQADGWYLRSDIIWSKPNPMPESVTDRPTKAHEYLFLLTKSPRYFWDADAIREPAQDWGQRTRDKGKWYGDDNGDKPYKPGGMKDADFAERGRNKRSVWSLDEETPIVLSSREAAELACGPEAVESFGRVKSFYTKFGQALEYAFCLAVGGTMGVPPEPDINTRLGWWEVRTQGNTKNSKGAAADAIKVPEGHLVQIFGTPNGGCISGVEFLRLHGVRNPEDIAYSCIRQALKDARSEGDQLSLGTGTDLWEIATAPYPDAHFATFPQALVEPCVKAGTSEHGCCPECGAPWEREVERVQTKEGEAYESRMGRAGDDFTPLHQPNRAMAQVPTRYNLSQSSARTTGWRPTCDHADLTPVPAVCLDPFLGSGTTAQVARRLGRKCVGIELNPDYAQLCAKRLQQLSLFASEHAEA